MTSQKPNILIAWHLLYYTFGLVPILVGIDKFFNFLVDWSIYIHPKLSALLGMSPAVFMHVVGIIEIAAGILLLLKPRLGACVVCAWLVGISIELVIIGYYDIALRDIGLAVGAAVLILLTRELDK